MREKTRAQGGLTPTEREKITDLLQLWTKRAARVEPIDPKKIIPAIEGIYAAAGLGKPRIAIAASPLTLALAYGAAAVVCEARCPTLEPPRGSPDVIAAALERMATIISFGAETSEVVDAAAQEHVSAASAFQGIVDLTETETHIAVGSEAYTSSYSARTYYRDSPLYREVSASFGFWQPQWHGRSVIQAVSTITSRRISVRRARELRRALGRSNGTQSRCETTHRHGDGGSADSSLCLQPTLREIEILIAEACHASAGFKGLMAAKGWGSVRHGGDAEFSQIGRLTAFRDVLGLELPSYDSFGHWEQAAIEGGMRVMHNEFCIICDFPEILKLDEQNRPHCENGPSHRWRDGWALYHWHGTRVPQAWIEDKASLDPAFALTIHNTELRRAALEIVGWHNVLRELKGKVIAEDPDPQHGRLVDVKLPGLRYPARFLHIQCATRREFAVGIPRRYRSIKSAHAWLTGLPTRKFKFPTVRT